MRQIFPSELPRRNQPTLLTTPRFRTSGLQNGERVNPCCLSHRVCGPLLQQLQETESESRERVSRSCSMETACQDKSKLQNQSPWSRQAGELSAENTLMKKTVSVLSGSFTACCLGTRRKTDDPFLLRKCMNHTHRKLLSFPLPDKYSCS